jgi:hypothetical protein
VHGGFDDKTVCAADGHDAHCPPAYLGGYDVPDICDGWIGHVERRLSAFGCQPPAKLIDDASILSEKADSGSRLFENNDFRMNNAYISFG